jgi:hypothetical protein
MHIGWYVAKPERVLSQNCVTCLPKPRSNTLVYGSTPMHTVVWKSLMGTALVRFGVRQHARAESISKRA